MQQLENKANAWQCRKVLIIFDNFRGATVFCNLTEVIERGCER